MKRFRFLALAVTPALLLLAASAAVLAQDAPPTVFIRQDPELGAFLTDPKGMTLYLFTKDTEGVSNCYDDCATAWPPFSAAEPLSLPGNVEGTLTTIQRTDGTTQVAYNGFPLYYWFKDAAPGDVTGQAVGGVWWLVAPCVTFGAVATPAAEPAPEGSPEAMQPAAAGEIAVTLSEFTVSASETVFKVGEAYTFTVTNSGQFPHELVIEKGGDNDVPLEANGEEVEVEDIQPGTSGSLTFTFTEPGVYQLACHLRSHYPMGMVVTIHVVE